MLNPMVQSDLVTYMGVTIVILFLQATIKSLPQHTTFLSQTEVLSQIRNSDYYDISLSGGKFIF